LNAQCSHKPIGVYSHDDPISIEHKKTASLETVLLFSPLKKFLKVGGMGEGKLLSRSFLPPMKSKNLNTN
jgi:hypothetical protein